MEAGKSRLRGDMLREANRGEVRTRKEENVRLKWLGLRPPWRSPLAT